MCLRLRLCERQEAKGNSGQALSDRAKWRAHLTSLLQCLFGVICANAKGRWPVRRPKLSARLNGHRAEEMDIQQHQRFCALALALTCFAHGSAFAQSSPAVQRGLVFVLTHCAQCHATDRVSESPLRIAPPFRDLHKRYPVESLEEAFAEGIQTGHPSMPEFRLDPPQISDVIAFLKSLE